MSQEKVDKRKYEKYHRKEIQRKQKIKTTILAVIGVLVLGTAIGIPLGYKIYESIPKTISPTVYNAWVSTYMQGLEGYPFVTEQENSTDEAATAEESTGEATGAEDSTGEAGSTQEVTEDSSENVTSEAASDTTSEQ